MPFTPFHLGPAFGFGLPLRKYLHTPTFIVGNVIVDVEPVLVLVLGLRYPLHGYLHTLLLAVVIGLALGYSMFFFEKFLHRLYGILQLEEDSDRGLKSFVVAGVLGTMLHVLLDAPLYGDIRPFYPITINPLYDPTLSIHIYSFCVWMGVIGVICYIGIFTLKIYRQKQIDI